MTKSAAAREPLPGTGQQSVLWITQERLIVRTAALPRERSLSIRRDALRNVDVQPATARCWRASSLLDARLLLIRADGHIIRLMPACTDAELRSVASLIRRAYSL